ncbi:MAG: hypothetical protein K0U86_19325 [Planctomycetes bacterium]|nr:hypothetical protein [Planctomycetota bacterium]MCH9775002.1 hypothetical protein [Planctomycetota bacterium]MCH9789501.1 hypothetical protein [Planctomycetota bacterium]MDF1745171.1 protoglobin domain-containing protein [Gimesia sp.]
MDLQPDSSADYEALANYLAFLKLTEVDSARLHELRPLFRSSANLFADTFYAHLLSFDETARFLQDPQVVQKLKELQILHWESLLNANWDKEFIERRKSIGRTHAERGIEPLFFLGSHFQFIEHLLHQFEAGNFEQEDYSEHFLSVIKAMFLDIGLTLESYFGQLSTDLRRALSMVWKANDELKQFARLTSHDLKTPLGTVANLCEEALDEFGDQMPEEAAELIGKARQTAFRMSGLIDELLSVSIKTQIDDANDEVSIDEVISEVLSRMSQAISENSFNVDVASPLPVVLGNKIQLREAFYNLISNAEKYIDKVPGQIQISAKSSEGDFIITITDNGPGIPAEELEQIFTAFRRLQMHQGHEGSGLGLYFAKSLIEHQGGKIWAESKLGVGSSFHVQLRGAQNSQRKD